MKEEVRLNASDLNLTILNFWKAEQKPVRKLRLFNVACCRLLQPWITESELVKVIDNVERFVDEALSESQIKFFDDQLGRRQLRGRVPTNEQDYFTFTCVHRLCTSIRDIEPPDCWRRIMDSGPHYFDRGSTTHAFNVVPNFFHDIFGNLFHPVAFDPAWRTSTAVGVAQAMYDARDFAAMPVLADALQDAGCEHADILQHCRDEKQVHVRGCWVVDLVLNKS